MNAPLKARLRHAMPGRLRAALEQPLPARDQLQALAAALAAVAGVAEVEIRPRSGSVVIRHTSGSDEEICRALAAAGLQIEAAPPAAGPADPIEATLGRLSAADMRLQQWSGGRIDIWNAGFTALVAAGFIQLARGQVAGPALTLFGQAATLVMARPLRRFLG